MTQPSQKPSARILVVDDDDQFRPALEMGLEDRGFLVACANGAEEAKKLLNSTEKFDAVVSDIQMPGTNGIELLKWIKANRPLPVILMTGFTEMLETLEAAQCGATGFLSKPFKHEDLVAALSMCFPSSGEENRDLDSDFCKIAIEEFVSGKDIKYDIYIRLSNAKYVKIAHCGQDIAVAKIRTFKEQGIHHLYLTKPDYKSYSRFNLNLAKVASQNNQVPREKKLVILRHATETMSTCAFADELDHETVMDARGMVENSIALVLDFPDVMKLVELMRTHSDFLFAHGVAVSFTSALLAKQMGWISMANHLKLCMAAVFHDIGKKELPRALLDKPKRSHTKEERDLYETHPERGAKLLSQLSDLPNDLAEIVGHHHENCVGFGFPARVRRDKIHPMARVMSVADVFCNHVLPGPEGPGVEPEQAIGRMVQHNAEIFDSDVSQALMRLFGYPVPNRFAEEQKWRQRAS
jgi:putative nucleotidyltransferase with HDIG domain